MGSGRIRSFVEPRFRAPSSQLQRHLFVIIRITPVKTSPADFPGFSTRMPGTIPTVNSYIATILSSICSFTAPPLRLLSELTNCASPKQPSEFPFPRKTLAVMVIYLSYLSLPCNGADGTPKGQYYVFALFNPGPFPLPTQF